MLSFVHDEAFPYYDPMLFFVMPSSHYGAFLCYNRRSMPFLSVSSCGTFLCPYYDSVFTLRG